MAIKKSIKPKKALENSDCRVINNRNAQQGNGTLRKRASMIVDSPSGKIDDANKEILASRIASIASGEAKLLTPEEWEAGRNRVRARFDEARAFAEKKRKSVAVAKRNL